MEPVSMYPVDVFKISTSITPRLLRKESWTEQIERLKEAERGIRLGAFGIVVCELLLSGFTDIILSADSTK